MPIQSILRYKESNIHDKLSYEANLNEKKKKKKKKKNKGKKEKKRAKIDVASVFLI